MTSAELCSLMKLSKLASPRKLMFSLPTTSLQFSCWDGAGGLEASGSVFRGSFINLRKSASCNEWKACLNQCFGTFYSWKLRDTYFSYYLIEILFLVQKDPEK